jgi:hypothetical protein
MTKKILLSSILFLTLFAVNSGVVWADVPVSGVETKPSTPSSGVIIKPVSQRVERLQNPIQSDDLKSLLASLVDRAIVLGTIFAVLMFIWIGFQFVTAQGDEGKIKDAKEWFTYAVVGTAILIGSKVILEVIKSTLIDSGLVQKGLF